MMLMDFVGKESGFESVSDEKCADQSWNNGLLYIGGQI